MARQTLRPRSHARQQPARPRQPLHRPQPHFRAGWIWVPIALVLTVYVLSHVQPTLSWDHIMDLLKVKNRERYTMLCQLGLLIVLIVSIARVLRDDDGRSRSTHSDPEWFSRDTDAEQPPTQTHTFEDSDERNTP